MPNGATNGSPAASTVGADPCAAGTEKTPGPRVREMAVKYTYFASGLGVASNGDETSPPCAAGVSVPTSPFPSGPASGWLWELLHAFADRQIPNAKPTRSVSALNLGMNASLQ